LCIISFTLQGEGIKRGGGEDEDTGVSDGGGCGDDDDKDDDDDNDNDDEEEKEEEEDVCGDLSGADGEVCGDGMVKVMMIMMVMATIFLIRL
jgi:hypothetical protein